jgi:hypothetical protein
MLVFLAFRWLSWGWAPHLIFTGKFSARVTDNHYADTGEWHPATCFLSAEHPKLVKNEIERIKKYREKGDLL